MQVKLKTNESEESLMEDQKEKIVAIGTLADKDIITYCKEGKLIIEEYCEKNIKQACYELRASNIYYDLVNGNKKNVLNQDEYILIKPKQMVVIITMETLELPLNILGRILTKGKLFSIGLLPVNTYADPGFTGQLGVVFNNLSNNFIKIYPGETIAKIEFCKLENSVSKPYSGQHGYQTKIWPVPIDMILTEEEIINDKRIKTIEEEIELSYGKGVGQVIKRVYKFERHLILAASFYLFFSLIFIAMLAGKGENILTPIFSVIAGVISNIVFSLLVYFSTKLKRGL